MSKNTGTSELINYFDLGVNGDVGIAGSLDINTIANATTDTDTFLVSDTGIIKYRTGAQLLSDIGAAPAVAGGYVPYFGGTSNVDLGVYNITASAIIANGSGSSSGILHLESNAIHSLVNGYGSIASGTTNQFNLYQTTGAGVFRGAILSLNSITASAIRTYTLPDSDGTLALTSQIPANAVGGTGTTNYLPKFTGASTIGNSVIQDTGTTVTISSNLVAINGNGITEFKINNNTSEWELYMPSGSTDLRLYRGTDKVTFLANGNVLIGTTTDNGARLQVSGTGYFGSTNYSNLIVDGTNSTGWGNNIAFRSQGTDFGYLGSIGSLLGNTTKDMTIWATAGNGFRVYTNGNNKQLEITTTGAATFSSSVTAASFISDGGGSEGVIRIERDTVGTNAVIGALNFTNNNGATVYGRVRGGRNSAGDGYVSLGTGIGDNLYAIEGGNVGIGTISPSGGKLVVTANSSGETIRMIGVDTIGDNYLTFVNTSATRLGYIGYGFSASNEMTISNDSDAPMSFYTNATERIRITSSGNVLIGTTTDNGQRLQVNGEISATSLRLSGSYNNTVNTDSSWTSYQTLIPTGTLSAFQTYIISIWWHFSGGSSQPYYYTCSFLFQPNSTNGSGVDNEFTPIGATHTGGTGATISFRSIAASGNSTSGVQARLNSFPTTGGFIYIRATLIQSF